MPRNSSLARGGAVDRPSPVAAGPPTPSPSTPQALPPVAIAAAGRRLGDTTVGRPAVMVAAEVPVALIYNGLSHAVMLATPADIEDFALGFSLSEGVLETPQELLDLEVTVGPTGIEAQMRILERRFAGLKERRRSLAGRTGCGLCGVESLAQVARPLAVLPAGPLITLTAVRVALAALPQQQEIHRLTGAVHAAAFADRSGRLQAVREDVGRHNALDKLIGAMVRRGIAPAEGFAIITSRCSLEMAQKAAACGIRVLVAISAPTTLALAVAEHTGLTLAALARADSITLYANPDRIVDSHRGTSP